ncbi:MAG: 50S ribosomal protein L11 methyltransferase [Acidobacteriota bacterium]
MQWIEITVKTQQQFVEAVSGLMSIWGVGGLVIEDPADARQHIAQGDWDAHGLTADYLDREYVSIKAYFPAEKAISPEDIEALKACGGTDCAVELQAVEDEDWADNWKQYYDVTRIGERLVIKPTWKEYFPENNDIIIELDPGMAFGTGTHITTRQCLQYLEQVMRGGERVLDIGTGSGILAIAAVKLGAGEVEALDLDPVAVRVANENFTDNGVAISAKEMDFNEYQGQPADIILANLTGFVIAAVLESITAHLKPGGLLIGAGISQSLWPDLRSNMEKNDLQIENTDFEEDWVGILARRC